MQVPRHRLLGLVVFFLWMYTADLMHHRSIADIIKDEFQFSQVYRMINDERIWNLFTRKGITVFVPASSPLLMSLPAAFKYNMSDPKMVEELFSYHIAEGLIYAKDIVDNVQVESIHQTGHKLHFNVFKDNKSKVLTVNGATIIDPDIQASNGVLHIVDRVIAPIASNKTLFGYTRTPDMPYFSFVSITAASIVDQALRNRTDNMKYQFTAFAPNDSVLFPVPQYAQDKLFTSIPLLTKTIYAHIVEGVQVYLPDEVDLPPLKAIYGDLKFERSGKDIFVTNNGVRANITTRNIPVANGVVHVIDNLLFYVYRDIMQTLEHNPHTRSFYAHLRKLPPNNSVAQELLSGTSRYTVFVPTEEAFAKLPEFEQKNLGIDFSLLTDVLGNHIVKNRTLSKEDMETQLVDSYDIIYTISNKSLSVYQHGKDLYLETANIKAILQTTDINCTNGIIHLINNVIMIRDYTLWDAINDNSLLTFVADMMDKYPDFRDILSGVDGSFDKYTIFLPSTAKIPKKIQDSLALSPVTLINALKGHLLPHVYTSLDIVKQISREAINGLTVSMENDKNGFILTGSYIMAKVLIKDIICSNGVLHIIDDIVHIPTRNILEEIARYSDLTIMRAYLSMTSLRYKLDMEDVMYTVFVPLDDAFDTVPRSKAIALAQGGVLLEKIMKAHIIPNVSLFAEELADGDLFLAEEEFIHVVKNNTHVEVVNNNVRAEMIRPNIRAVNGKIHVIDRLLYFPYRTIYETISEDSDFQPIYEILNTNDEFRRMAESGDHQMTLFVPSATFLRTVPTEVLSEIKASPELVMKLFMSHAIPGARLDSMFMRQHLIDNYIVKSRYNVTFSFLDQVSGTSVDSGFPNLHQVIDLSLDGRACSNGIAFLINGLLNYSFQTLLQVITSEQLLKYSAEHFFKLLQPGVEREFNQSSATDQYTVFMPSDQAFHMLTQWDYAHLNTDFNYKERLMLYDRHVINGSLLTYEDIINGGNQTFNSSKEEIYITVRNSKFYLCWNNIEASFVKSNLLASNGIVHIIDRIFIKGTQPETTPTSPATPTKMSQNVTDIGRGSFLHPQSLTILISFLLLLECICAS